MHLAAGLLAGLVILVLGVTGVIMSFERQILEANTGVKVVRSPEQTTQLGAEAILAKFADAKPAATAVVFNSDADKPVLVQFGRGKSEYVNPYTGESLGEGNKGLKEFFAWVLRLHRWLTLDREIGGKITGPANLVFLFLVVSGLYLWFPKRWTRPALKAVTTLKFRLKGKARDWNWHNVFGFWACIPLFLIVVTGAVMSYTWANNLIFQAVGEKPPAPRGQGGPPGGMAEGPRGEGRPRGEGGQQAVAREGGERERGPRAGGEARPEGGMRERGGREGGPRGGDSHDHDHDQGPVDLAGLDAGLSAAKAASPEWLTISVAMPKDGAAQYTVAASHRGRPDLRRTLTVDLANGSVTKNEGFEAQTTGRKLRTFVRWVHTGEALGWFGQTIMGLAALSSVVLVWTGFALSWRRFFKKRRVSIPKAEAVKEAA
ncbi:MAG TPA: PepSY-associated TM helix domain-containing protein [Luteolibacter sp.]|nr:PepSY-associated TM helix domain-containing protein [Luteolibacter sp.]